MEKELITKFDLRIGLTKPKFDWLKEENIVDFLNEKEKSSEKIDNNK